MLLGLVVCLTAYLAITVPGDWFPASSPRAFDASMLSVSRGTGTLVNDELQVTAADDSGLILISQATDLRAEDYAAIAWVATDVPSTATVRLLWRTQQAPTKLNALPIEVESGRTLPVIVSDNGAWAGKVTGLALAIQGPLTETVRIRGVIAKPMGALELLGDRFREWTAFEGWSGTSINTLSGGADIQALPLPLLLAITIALAAAGAALYTRRHPVSFPSAWPVTLSAFFLIGWLVLDVRWTQNLGLQEWQTAKRYAGKTSREKHLLNEDGPLFDLILRARTVLPPEPVRIFLASDANYFRGRAAYHLYPHSVYFDPRKNDLEWTSSLHPGDWVLVYQQRGIQYDPSKQMLKWPSGQTTPAELKVVVRGGALFLIR